MNFKINMDTFLYICQQNMPTASAKLDLEDHAIPARDALLQHVAKPQQPDLMAHLNNRKHPELQRDVDETDAEYRGREAAVEQAPAIDLEWLYCALVSNLVLGHIVNQIPDRIKQNGYIEFHTPEGHRRSVSVYRVYDYVWLCLNRGLGKDYWKQKPPQPPQQKRGEWMYAKSTRLLHEVVSKWEKGSSLGDMLPGLTWDDVLPSPYHGVVIHRLQAAINQPEEEI